MKLKDKINKVINNIIDGTLYVYVGKQRINGKTYYLFQDQEYYDHYDYVSAQTILEKAKEIH